MEGTPERHVAADPARFSIVEDDGAARRPMQRLKKPPPITPRRFEKFFTPRPRNARHAVRTSRAALQDITGPALNRRKLQPRNEVDLPTIHEQPPCKKRKLSFSSPVSSLQSSPIKRPPLLSSGQEPPHGGSRYRDDMAKRGSNSHNYEIDEEEDTDIEDIHIRPAESLIRPYRMASTSASLLSSRISGRRAKREVDSGDAWQHSAANFYTGSEDVYSSSTLTSGFLTLPFSVSSCNTNSLIAVGNEDGNVQLVDSAAGNKDGFSKTYLTMKPHDNAIMDLEFSNDDALLATASGDQTSHVIDMQTQTSIYCLSGHYSSIKRVQFQPGSGNNVIATSSRDGCVNFWDLRCRTIDRPSFHLRSAGRSESDAMTASMRYSTLTNSIREAHALSPNRLRKVIDPRARNNPVSGRNDFSVTSFSFLGPSRPHMIVTASEVDSVVKLWDMRTTYTARRGRPVPISCTREPKSHELHRRFGLTSVALSGDGARLYTLCRDHTVYTYATSHLVLGDAPELSTASSRSFRPHETPDQGLGPLYGFRHPRLRISTFYPKLAIRRSNASDTELLAVGSSDDCAILFPTDKRYLTNSAQMPRSHPSSQPAATTPPQSIRHDSSLTHSFQEESGDELPIYHHGTPLTRGHRKEVTAVTWTSEGSLVTASDDFNVRCWREDAGKARDMRLGGEGEGRRWGSGWAEVNSDYDEED